MSREKGADLFLGKGGRFIFQDIGITKRGRIYFSCRRHKINPSPFCPSDNRGAGACIGAQCRGLPNGAKVRIDVVD